MRASKNKKAARTNSTGCLFGTHKRIRTSDPSLRRRVLYPAELCGHNVAILNHDREIVNIIERQLNKRIYERSQNVHKFFLKIMV